MNDFVVHLYIFVATNDEAGACESGIAFSRDKYTIQGGTLVKLMSVYLCMSLFLAVYGGEGIFHCANIVEYSYTPS